MISAVYYKKSQQRISEIAGLIFQAVSGMKMHYEQLMWIFALLFLYFMDTSGGAHSFCLFRFIGFTYCPGCGIGHSIHHALHFEFRQSFHNHILGMPATIGLFYLIFKPVLSFTAQTKLSWISNKCL